MQESRKHPINSTPFEAFCRGSWHETDTLSIINGKIFIQIGQDTSTIEKEICGDYIRLRSRKANAYDCSNLLKVGVDVCVLSTRHNLEKSNEESQLHFPLWYDAKIISKKSGIHNSRCSCLFSVIIYKERALSATGKNIVFERAEIVTIDRIAILQRLSGEPCETEFHKWSFSDDSISSSRSKFLSGIVSSEVSWLVVLSILKRISFHIKLLHDSIVYQINDSNTSFSNTMEGIKVIQFRRFNEQLRPVIQTLAPLVLAIGMGTEAPLEVESELDIKKPLEVDSESEVEVLYDCKSLRRSKRQRIQPDRFTSYASPNFNRNSSKNMDQVISIAEQENQLSIFLEEEEHFLDNLNLCLVERNSDDEYSPTSESGRRNILHEKVKDIESQLLISLDVEEVCEVHPSNFSGNLKEHALGKTKRGRGRPRIRDGSTSQSGAMHAKRNFYRKKKILLSAVECEKLIQQCIGNIEAEMETELQAGFQSAKITPEELEEFKWSPSPVDHSEVEEHEDLWTEMEHTINALSLLEQKQELDLDPSSDIDPNSSDDVKQQCNHEFKLDEQIGIICQLCDFVQTEIRDVLPQFMMSDCWNSNRENFGKEEFRNIGSYYQDSSFLGDAISRSDIISLVGDGNVWGLIPELKLKLYNHQKKAYEFIWRNIAGSLKPQEMEVHSDDTGGCVISHSPGSGKTLLLISFIVSFLRLFPRSRPLILAPKITVYVWRKEFEKWGVQFPLHIIYPIQSFKKTTWNCKIRISSTDRRKPNRKMRHAFDSISKLQQWHKEPSVLLMSYSSFSLMQKDSKDVHKKFMAKVLQESPGLLVLDEGHNPRSTISKLRKLLMAVKTKSRILLSGTLFQNNFEEYFNTLCLARPSFAEDVLMVVKRNKLSYYKKSEKRSTKKERIARKLFVQRIGEKIESSMEDDRKQGFDVLNKITKGFIDIYENDNSLNLPGLHIYTIVLLPTEIQHEVLVRLQSCLQHTRRYPIELELLITVGSIHPWLIKTMAHADDYFNDGELENIEKYKDNFKSGSKVKFVFDIVHKSTLKKEKVLIFSHNIPPINLLVKFFEKYMGWHKGEEVLVLQGDQELSIRAKIMDKFNGDVENKCRVLFASTSACAEGISLTAASRVVLLDSEWNHSKTRQAIARAFRPGQEREVYVYKLLASGTWEQEKYQSNEWKAWLSKMILIGEYIENNSCRKVDVVDDNMLRELVEEDQGSMFQMIMKQD
ncbi:CHD3-type chromatin-remodeling factor PICKLE [Apostasia shenzhenica]|uniref:CHD3-type chromatin-remodeling factor PICKLE n=1 Tax=Apostasia shenzhenica TaxID=1088818 RepID=A0A2I0BHH9_9ASPA|nr:CHD3-type chromatin-remodeling factor PICKLE [Apostasia shenzhenica]